MEKPTITTTSKGFIDIPINIQQNLHVGGQCICDCCNSASFDTMHYIPVLAGRTYCQDCFNRWHADAQFYTEDQAYEKAKANQFIKLF